MNKNYAHIVIILDRSGSMEAGKQDMQGGLDVFLADQKKFSIDNPDKKCTLSFVRFDGSYELIHDFVDINSVDRLLLEPRGFTALNDALGKTINDVGAKLNAMQENEKPSTVTVLVITDGQENSSVEFSTTQVKEMIKRQESEYNWKFVYLGADHDAFHVSDNLGISRDSSSQYKKRNGHKMFSNLSAKILGVRSCSNYDAMVYSNEEKEGLNS